MITSCNYGSSYSFFSAPNDCKDEEVKMEAIRPAIPIQVVVVEEELEKKRILN